MSLHSIATKYLDGGFERRMTVSVALVDFLKICYGNKVANIFGRMEVDVDVSGRERVTQRTKS
jgi:hypothetical protein